jgi:hypothetical protein
LYDVAQVQAMLLLLDPEVYTWWNSRSNPGIFYESNSRWRWTAGVEKLPGGTVYTPYVWVREDASACDIARFIIDSARGGNLSDSFNTYQLGRSKNPDQLYHQWVKNNYAEAAAQAAFLADLYVKGLMTFNGGADVVVTITDLAENGISLANVINALPLVSRRFPGRGVTINQGKKPIRIPAQKLAEIASKNHDEGQKLADALSQQISPKKTDVDCHVTSAPKQLLGKTASSSILGKNLEAMGVVRPSNSAAHHIVAGSDRRAALARSILQREGIDINEAANGVFLPRSSGVARPPRTTHSRVHTDLYYREVEQRLRNAAPGTVRTELDRIANELLNGIFPF